jgi:hypothetical protein
MSKAERERIARKSRRTRRIKKLPRAQITGEKSKARAVRRHKPIVRAAPAP